MAVDEEEEATDEVVVVDGEEGELAVDKEEAATEEEVVVDGEEGMAAEEGVPERKRPRLDSYD